MNNKIIQIIITTILILIIILLIYMIIIYLIKPYKKLETFEKQSGNFLQLNKHFIKKISDSTNINYDYIQKYKINNNYTNFDNYNLISNKDDARNFFQANDAKFYLNIK